MMSRIASKVICSLGLLACAAHASAARCPLKVLQPHGQTINVPAAGDVALGVADDSAHPSAWQGPLSAATCSIDIGIIEAPMVAARPGTIFVTTTSGALRRLVLVDVAACKIGWQSAPFGGAVQVDKTGMTLGQRHLRLDPQCTPTAPSSPSPAPGSDRRSQN